MDYETTIDQTDVVIDDTEIFQVLNSDFTIEVSTTATNNVHPLSAVPLYFTGNPEQAGQVGLSIAHELSNEALQVRMGDGTQHATVNFEYGFTLSLDTPATWRVTCRLDGSGRRCSVLLNGQRTTPEFADFAVAGNIYNNNGGVFGDVWGWRFIGTLHYVQVGPSGKRTHFPSL